MKKFIDRICDNAPCIMAAMFGVSALIASQTMTHMVPRIIEMILGAGLLYLAGKYWDEV